MRTALLLTGAVVVVLMLYRLLAQKVPMPKSMDFLMTVFVFGGASYLGMGVYGSTNTVPIRELSHEQIYRLVNLGIWLVSPLALTADLVSMLMQRADVLSVAHMLPTASMHVVMKSIFVAPILEELFFRGYVLSKLAPFGKKRAILLSALGFALAHSGNGVMYALLGVLLGALTLRTESILAPILVHAGYNAALIVLSACGLSGVLMGWSFHACALRLMGCAICMVALKKAISARGTLKNWSIGLEGEILSRQERRLLMGASLVLIAVVILGG